MSGPRTRASQNELIRQMIERRLRDLHTAGPGSVATYDPMTKTAEIIPHFRILNDSGKPEMAANLPSVPVLFPQSSTFIMDWLLVPGDLVAVWYFEQSTDRWILKGSPVDPDSIRRHDLSDAFCTPTFNIGKQLAAVDPLDPAGANVRIARLDGAANSIKLKPDGTIVIQSGPSGNVQLVSETAVRSPVPSAALQLWLTDLFTMWEQWIADLSSELGTDYPGVAVKATAFITQLQEHMAKFIGIPGGAGYGCSSSKVKIP